MTGPGAVWRWGLLDTWDRHGRGRRVTLVTEPSPRGDAESPLSPVYPFNAPGQKAVWQDWRACHCDPARRTGTGWWHDQDHQALADLVRRVIGAFADPNRRDALRLQLSFAVEAINDRGLLPCRSRSPSGSSTIRDTVATSGSAAVRAVVPRVGRCRPVDERLAPATPKR